MISKDLKVVEEPTLFLLPFLSPGYNYLKQEKCLKYTSKGELYATTHTPIACCRNLCMRLWLHDLSQ